jgi:hypothetical protein
MTNLKKWIELVQVDQPDETSRRILLADGRRFAIVDEQDYDRLTRHKWSASGNSDNPHAQRYEAGKLLRMHRQIIDIPPGYVCDHINHNRLDNRRCNLRPATIPQNAWNALPRSDGVSRYKGVSWDSRSKRWQATICHLGRIIYIGQYLFEEDAAIAYDDMALKLFGEFAALNCRYRPELMENLQQSLLF